MSEYELPDVTIARLEAEAQALREEVKNRTAECNGLHEMLRQEHDRTEKAREEVADARRDAERHELRANQYSEELAALRARVVVLPSVDSVMNIVMRYQWNEKTNVTGTTNWAANLGMKVVDEVKRLNGKAVSEELLHRIADTLDDVCHGSALEKELRALLGEGKEHE